MPRKPRVHIFFEANDPNAIRKTELPWVTLVMAALSGDNAGALAPLAERKVVNLSAANFNEVMKGQKVRVSFKVPNRISGEGLIGIDVPIEALEDLEPDRFAKLIGATMEDVRVLQRKGERGEVYEIIQDGPMSLQLGESIDDRKWLDDPVFIGMRLGEKPGDLEVTFNEDKRKPEPTEQNAGIFGKGVLRIVRKGHIAKLLEIRNQLKELLTKVDGNAPAQEAIAKLIRHLAEINNASNPSPA